MREEAAARAVGALVAVDAEARLVLPLLLEGLRLGVAGPRVGLGEREGREVRRQRRERVRVLLVGRGRGSLKPSRVGGARIRPWRFRFGLLRRFRLLRCSRWCGAVGVGSLFVPHTTLAYCQFAQLKGRPSFYALGACRDAAIFREQTIVGTKTASAGLELHSCRNARSRALFLLYVRTKLGRFFSNLNCKTAPAPSLGPRRRPLGACDQWQKLDRFRVLSTVSTNFASW